MSRSDLCPTADAARLVGFRLEMNDKVAFALGGSNRGGASKNSVYWFSSSNRNRAESNARAWRP